MAKRLSKREIELRNRQHKADAKDHDCGLRYFIMKNTKEKMDKY